MSRDFEQEMKRGHRLLTVFTFLPFLILGAIFFGGRVPATWRNLYFLGVIGGALAFIVSVPVREHNRSIRKSGFRPIKKGFSAKLDAMAETFRRQATEIESSLREGEEVSGLPRDLQAEYNELLRVARAQDKKTPLSSFDFRIKGEDERTISSLANRLRERAGEMEIYAQQLRARGGIFKLGMVQTIYGGVLLLAAFAWGCSLAWKWWDTPSWTFFGGVALIVSSAGLGYGLVKSQSEPA